MTRPEAYTVQRCIDAEGPVFDGGRSVEALGAVAAAEELLGGPLVLSGPRHALAGRVLGLDAGYRPTSIFVYRANGGERATSPG